MVIFCCLFNLEDCSSLFALYATQPSQDAHSSMSSSTKPQCSILAMTSSIKFEHLATNPSSMATLSTHIVSAQVPSLCCSGNYSSQQLHSFVSFGCCQLLWQSSSMTMTAMPLSHLLKDLELLTRGYLHKQFCTSKSVTLLPTCVWLLLLFTLLGPQMLILLF
jgi:hypothetical protein